LWLERVNRLALIVRQLSTTVHDVNNMLQVISGHAELLVTSPGATEAMLKRGGMISAQAQRATLALAELADFAKDVSERQETVQLLEIGQRALGMRTQALSRLRVTPVVDGDEVSIQGNSRRLVQIALNLIVNAEKALAGRSDPRLRIAVARAGNRVELVVEDHSTGDAVKTPVMASSDVPYSLGIGLEVSKWLAEQQQGTLERVTLAGGSRATLSLPLKPSMS
jgi:C4-dicarboxylate-specific signal transduction histidine kinase